MNLDILLVALTTAWATALIGIFLVLRKLSMLTDAIAHTVLLGIVVMFMWVRDLNSPWLLLGASVSGVVTVFMIERVRRIRLVKEDAAIGLVMTFLFSVAIILLSTRLRNVHLHIDTVLLGQLEFVMFERTTLFNVSLPTSFWVMLVVLILNSLFMLVLFKEYKLLSFDQTLAKLLGFTPWLLHYLFMTLISLTAVAAFNAVGAIMVIAFMVGPVMSARLLTHRMKPLIGLSLAVATFNAFIGYLIAFAFDLNTSASMATLTLATFILILLFSPYQGIFKRLRRQAHQRKNLEMLTLMHHINTHHQHGEAALECHVETLHHHFAWPHTKMQKVLASMQKKQYLIEKNAIISLSPRGDEYYRKHKE